MSQNNKESPSRIPSSNEKLEQKCIAAAYRRGLQRLEDGTATAQELLFWYREGSRSSELARREKESKISLQDAKVNEIQENKSVAELYTEAIAAFSSYRGSDDE